ESARSSEGADYLIAGHVFATASKRDLPPIGVDGLRRIADAAPCPVLAIGGISAANVPSVLAVGAFGVAIISAISGAPDPAAAARAIAQCISTTEKNMDATATTVKVTINGKPVSLADDTTVRQFLQSKGFEDRLVVVELNEAILPRTAYDSTVLSAGDRVEIVHFVGGG
ncbi:MAG TPA: sulfur carrier protein ThiS, partial [Thermomicrobiales bacterium]